MPDTPALLTMTCKPPKRSTARRHQSAHLVDVGHVGLDEEGVGADVRRERGTAVAVDVGDDDTLAPSAANLLGDAAAWIPDAAPVTMATLPTSSSCQFPGSLQKLKKKSSSTVLTGVGLLDLRTVPGVRRSPRNARRRICPAIAAAHPGGSNLSPRPSTTRVGTVMRS